MVFNVLIGNTDDQARNHVFYVIDEKISLTPAANPSYALKS